MTTSVGVVIAARNAATLLPQTLESLARQTVKPDAVIVVDDGSTDDTAEIAASWGAQVARQQGTGVSRARNVGIRRLNTKYIAFCDADDLWEPTKLQKQVSALDANPGYGVSFCDYYVFDRNRTRHPAYVREFMPEFIAVGCRQLSGSVHACEKEMITRLSMEQSFVLPSGLVIRSELLAAPEPFSEDVAYGEDLELLLRLLAKNDVLYINEPLMGYRLHDSSAMCSTLKNPLRARTDLVRLAVHILVNRSDYDPACVLHYRAMLPVFLFKAGRMYASVGKVKTARWLLARSFGFSRRLETAAWYLLAPLFYWKSLRHVAFRARKRTTSEWWTPTRETGIGKHVAPETGEKPRGRSQQALEFRMLRQISDFLSQLPTVGE